MTRETDRLIIRELEETDAPVYSRYLKANDAYLRPWSPARAEDYHSEAKVRQLISSSRDSAASRVGFIFGLFRKADMNLIGTVGISNVVYGAFQSCNLGYELGEDAVGSGYMTEGLRVVVEFCFTELKLHRIEANVMPRNRRSKRVLTRLGFEYEGTSRKYLRINGHWEDHEHFVLLNSETE